jgi:23S rRNA U2552 (ribose-2'-O)-methylase RlmE/FtsJ
MLHFTLARLPNTTYKHIDCIESIQLPKPVLSNSLSGYLADIKDRIDEYSEDWDTYKKYTNPYEYIHTTVPTRRRCVSQYKPLSRSYFKMIELAIQFRLFGQNAPIRTFHLAEGPGGFIEAARNMRNNPSDLYVGMTLLHDDRDRNIPAWKKSHAFLRDNSNVFIETGADKTGDILSLANFVDCTWKYGSTMDVITADGGFDFSIDFSQQEIHITKLLFAQICFALCMQKRGGSFVIKIFDSFMPHTIDILMILSSFYSRVYVTKPLTSRFANSEKYVVCKGFQFDHSGDFYPYLYRAFEKMLFIQSVAPPGFSYIGRLLTISPSHYFITRLEEYNAIFGQQQIESIFNTISLICDEKRAHKNWKGRDRGTRSNISKEWRSETRDTFADVVAKDIPYINHPTIDPMIRGNIKQCIQWCMKYGVPYHVGI